MNEFYKKEVEIREWLDEFKITDYTLIPDKQYGFVVDCHGLNVDLSWKGLLSIPVKFGAVSGSFWCNYNKLTNLSFAPPKVGGLFSCNNNKLETLEGTPLVVAADYLCMNNILMHFAFFPQKVSGKLHCFDNPALRELQKVTDFKTLCGFHKKHKITYLYYQKLDEELEEKSDVNARKQIKL